MADPAVGAGSSVPVSALVGIADSCRAAIPSFHHFFVRLQPLNLTLTITLSLTLTLAVVEFE